MTVVAKMRCHQARMDDYENLVVELAAVYSSDPDDVNYSWSKYTPGGTVTLFISNPDAHKEFELGGTYMVAFNRVEDDYPVVKLPGSEQWESAYDAGVWLDNRFPGHDAHQFCQACEHNDWGPLENRNIRIVDNIIMVQQGEHDGQEWVWVVTIGNQIWTVVGGCDYTGWDCQSSLTWTKVEKWS